MNNILDYNQAQFDEMILFWKDRYPKRGSEYTLEVACIEWIGLHGESFYNTWQKIHNIG